MGDVGRNYSAQWRSYKGEAIAYNSDNNSFIYERHDQIKELIADMRENIMSTRLKVASWIKRNKQNSASSMSRQFPSHRSSFVR
jgi:thymidylate synthase